MTLTTLEEIDAKVEPCGDRESDSANLSPGRVRDGISGDCNSDQVGTFYEGRVLPTSVHVYNPQKPKWWKKLVNNGRDATKSQKRAMRKIMDGKRTKTKDTTQSNSIEETTTVKGLRLPSVPYGSKLNWNEVFPNSSEDSRDIWLELGFGRGENLQALLESKLSMEEKRNLDADIEPSVDPVRERSREFHLVGAEVSGVGIGCLCKRIDQRQQQAKANGLDPNQDYILYHPEMNPYSSNSERGTSFDRIEPIDDDLWAASFDRYDERLRIHAGDGYKLLPKLPDKSLAAILVTFPDPFPKETHITYRLIQHQTLIECHRILRSGNGRLFLATDHDGYHEWCHQIMNEVNSNNINKFQQPLFLLQDPCPNRMDWLPAVSRYEQKGWDEGRSTKLSCWLTIRQNELYG